MAMARDKFEEGMRIRREVLGDAHVARSEANMTSVDADFQRFITETVWGLFSASGSVIVRSQL